MSDVPALRPLDEHNRKLEAQVHPPGWANPEPKARYNLVVIGAGTAGLVTAAGAAGLGAKVALVERDLMGGDCLNVGCVPSKALIAAARAVAAVRDAAAFGVDVPPGTRADFPRVMERLRRLRAGIAHADSAERFRGLGVDVFFGAARFADEDVVEVGDRKLRYARAVIATGARAAAPPIPGIAEAGFLTNETVFSLTELPRRLAVVGAGPIGCELAQAFARLGAEVTLVEVAPQILVREDRDAAEIVERALVRDGVRLACGRTIERAERTAGGAKALRLAGGETVECDEILIGVGRAPNVEGLDLERVGVAYEKGTGVQVDDYLQTTNPNVYACGDVCTPLKFTHHSDFQARTVIQNALFFGRSKASALVVPWCTYTEPEIAHVGLSEAEAKKRGIAIKTFVQRFEEVDRAILDGETEGFVKVHVAEKSDEILGATIVAARAGDLISEITVAMAGKIGLGALARVIHPYPTQAEAIRKLGDQYNRTRLTPFVKTVFDQLLAWRR